MNHLANCSAQPQSRSCDAPEAKAASETGGSVACSHITENTITSEKRTQAARERRAALENHVDEDEWDRSTRVGDEAGREKVASQAQVVDQLFRENPEFMHVHSAQSLHAMLESRASALKAQACA